MFELPSLIEFDRKHQPGTATYGQCKRIYALMAACGMKPVWVNEVPYSAAIALQAHLEQIRYIQRKNGRVMQ